MTRQTSVLLYVFIIMALAVLVRWECTRSRRRRLPRAPGRSRVLTDDEGRYQLATGAKVGLAPGNYAVVIAATESEPAAAGSESSKKRVITPARYANPKQSGFHAEVKPGSNTFDFELTSGAKI
jgi:hypothetical protein